MNRVSAHIHTSLLILLPAGELPPKTLRNSIDHNTQLPIQLRSITASRFTWLWPGHVSLNPYNHGVQVHLQTHWIMTSKCIFEFTHLQLSSASQICSLSASRLTQSIASKLIRLWLPSSSPISFQHGLQLSTISGLQLARLKPLSASPNSLNNTLKVR